MRRRLLLVAVLLPVVAALSYLIILAVSPKITSTAHADHWGAYFGDGRRADIRTTVSPTPIYLPGRIAELGTSNSTQYVLLTDGTLWAWGQGTNGQLGNGNDVNSFTKAVQVQFPRGVTIARVPSDAMPFDTALAVDTDGHVWGWGLNKRGELCLGTTRRYDTPQMLPLAEVTALAGANGHAVYDSAGTVYSCGEDIDGVLGNGTKGSNHESNVPVKVVGLPTGTVTSLFSAFDNDGALLRNGSYWDWGMNTAGQLGTNSRSYCSTVPVQVKLPGAVTEVAEGGSDAQNGQTLVKLADGSMYAWGADSDYQLGNGQTSPESSPIPLVPPRGVTYAKLASGGGTSYGLTPSGHLYAWGAGTNGQIGNGHLLAQAQPVIVNSGVSMISSTAYDVVVSGG